MPPDNMRSPIDALSDRVGIYDPRMTVCDPKATPGHQTTPEEVIEEVNRIFAEVEGTSKPTHFPSTEGPIPKAG